MGNSIGENKQNENPEGNRENPGLAPQSARSLGDPVASSGLLDEFESVDQSRILGKLVPTNHLIFGVSSQKTNIVTEYFPKKEKFFTTRKPKIDLLNYCGTVLKTENVAIICGGISFDLKQITPSCYELDLVTRETRELAAMHDYRYTFPVAYLDKRIYAVGGRVFGNDNVLSLLDSCERYDYRTNKWTRIASMNKKRCTSALAVVNGHVWVFGGFSTGGKRTKKVERYNDAQDVWEIVPFRLTVGVDAFNIIPAKEKDSFIIYGGKLQDNTSSRVIKYCLADGSYTGLANSGFDNLIAKCFALNDVQFFIVGDKKGMLTGEIFDIRSEKIVRTVHIGGYPLLSDLKKLNTINFTTELQVAFQPPPPAWSYDPADPFAGKSATEAQAIRRKYNGKNLLFGTDLRSYILEIDSRSGEIKERGVPTALGLACFQGVARIEPHVVMFCGGVNRSFSKIFDNTYLLNLETYAVEKLPNMPVAKYTFNLMRMNGYVYAMGGRVYGESSQSVIGSVERYNLSRKTWESIRGLGIPRCTSNCHVIQDRIFVMGGFTRENKRTNKIEVFSENTNEFLAYGMLLDEPTEAAFSFQRGNTILFCGGRRSNDKAASKEILEFGAKDLGGSRPLSQLLKNRGYLQKGVVYKDFLFIFFGTEAVENPDLDCLFLKTFENVLMDSMFEEERRELQQFSQQLIRVVQRYTDGNEGLKHDSFVTAMGPII